MPHELFLLKNNKMINITPIIGEVSWRSNLNELGQGLDFSVALNDTRFFPINPVEVGDLIILKNKEEIFRGIVIADQTNGRNPVTYNCFDFAFYLNKSKEVYQFKKVTATQAITKILNDFKVPIGNIVNMKTVINKIYIDEEVSGIIKDIIKLVESETGQKLRMEMRNGKLYIEKQSDLVVKATFSLAANLLQNNITDAISNPTKRRSIEDMKNSIKIISEDKVVVEVKNDSLIKQFGLLQDIHSVDKKDIAQAKNIANNLLKDLGRVLEENEIEVPGNDNVRAGRIIEINEPVTGLRGQYLITDVRHALRNNVHTMILGLGVV